MTSLPSFNTEMIDQTNSKLNVVDEQVKILLADKTLYKYKKYSDDVEIITLPLDHTIIELANDNIRILNLPYISDMPIFYLIRKKYVGELRIVAHTGNTIEGVSEIELINTDRLIHLTNNTVDTWLII
jgi:hypothetical protein